MPLSDMLATLVERGARLMERRPADTPGASGLADHCEALLSRTGEASAVAQAAGIIEGIEALDEVGFREFATLLATRFDPDPEEVRAAAEDYALDPTSANLAVLQELAEPPRQEVLRRLNLAPGGTAKLVRIRERLLPLLKDTPALRRIDADFRHLFASWFNRGFLVMQPVDWSTPADILEKIIRYEAVHAIDSWDELRRRLAPPDRRCFAFFHPAMPSEPLIFVEVALTREIPAAIGDVLTEDRAALAAVEATTAVFYSISNCQRGLAGVSFGNFLIKQVAQDLSRDLPNLTTFVTLSPVPGLMRWVEAQAERGQQAAVQALEGQGDMIGLAATYLLTAKRDDGQPLDPVARFHLGNGAILRQLNPMADPSPRGMAQSGGVMVNYLYDLGTVEENHEAYAEHHEVIAARPVKAMLPSPAKTA